MPRTGNIYSEPAGTKATPNTTIQSAPYNAFVDDLVADANAARPITAGGTGATSASAARTALGLGIGTNVQAYDAGLTSIAGLTTAADRMIYTTAADVYAVTTLTAFGRSLLDDANAAAGRATLGLGTSSTIDTGTSGATIPLLNAANTWSGTQTMTSGALRWSSSFIIGRSISGAQAEGLELSSSASTASSAGAWAKLWGSADPTNPGDFWITSGSGGNIQFRNQGNLRATVTSNGFLLDTDAFISFAGTGAASTRTQLGLGTIATQNTINNADWSGTDLSIANGGTGASDAATARTNLGLGSIATQSSVNNADWSGTDLSIANGGTGASDAATARNNLGLGGLATMDVTGLFYTGSSAANLTFPVSSYLAATDNGTATRNAATVLTLYTSNSAQFTVDGAPNAGSALAGTWRQRGVTSANVSQFQRTA